MSLKLAPFGDGDGRVGHAGVFVADVLDEQQDEDVVLVLAGIHAAAQFVAAGPEGGVEFGFLEGHNQLPFYWFGQGAALTHASVGERLRPVIAAIGRYTRGLG